MVFLPKNFVLHSLCCTAFPRVAEGRQRKAINGVEYNDISSYTPPRLGGIYVI